MIAGSVGNLPRVHNMDIQYAQSGVFTPCDFAFPTDGKRAEATPNTEMILVSDVDLDLLNELHTYGSVRNLRDRRNDLYELRMKRTHRKIIDKNPRTAISLSGDFCVLFFVKVFVVVEQPVGFCQ